MPSQFLSRFARLVTAAAIAAALASFAGPAATPARAATATTQPALGLELMRLTNLDRVANGLRPLAYDPTLAGLAADRVFSCPSGGSTYPGRAADMAARNYLSHTIPGCTKPNGSGYTILDVLYPPFGYNTYRAENIASNTYPGGQVTFTSGCDLSYANCRGVTTYVDQRVMVAERGFIKSATHRSNVLGSYDRFGCGAATSTYGAFFTCLFSSGGPTATSQVPVVQPPAYSSVRYHALTPARIVDTRSGLGLTGALTSQVPAAFAVTGKGGVPAGAVSVTGNLTVTGVSRSGYVAISPIANATPRSSTLNLPAGDTRANGVSIPLDPAGRLAVTYVSDGRIGDHAQLVFDVTGYFINDSAGAGYVAVGPVRLVDSRSALGGVTGPIRAGTAVTFAVGGRSGVPSNAIAVAGNLTITSQTGPGFLALTQSPTARPGTSTLNAPLGDTRANNVVAPLGSGGTLSVTFVSSVAGATAQVVFDVSGAFVPNGAGAAYYPITPTRVVDTRRGMGISSELRNGVYSPFGVTAAGVPSGALAVTGNATVITPSASGWLAISPSGTVTTSSLNFPTNDIRANGAISPVTTVGTSGALYGASTTAGSQFVFDVTGYFR